MQFLLLGHVSSMQLLFLKIGFKHVVDIGGTFLIKEKKKKFLGYV
jgi:hypothetical protein